MPPPDDALAAVPDVTGHGSSGSVIVAITEPLAVTASWASVPSVNRLSGAPRFAITWIAIAASAVSVTSQVTVRSRASGG